MGRGAYTETDLSILSEEELQEALGFDNRVERELLVRIFKKVISIEGKLDEFVPQK